MGLDAKGEEFEMEVDASKINPSNCSYNEMMILNLETNNGKVSPKDFLNAAAMRSNAKVDSYFKNANYMACAEELMEDYKTVGSYDSYLSMKQWIQRILDYITNNKEKHNTTWTFQESGAALTDRQVVERSWI